MIATALLVPLALSVGQAFASAAAAGVQHGMDFVITTPNNNSTWTVGTKQSVTWFVDQGDLQTDAIDFMLADTKGQGVAYIAKGVKPYLGALEWVVDDVPAGCNYIVSISGESKTTDGTAHFVRTSEPFCIEAKVVSSSSSLSSSHSRSFTTSLSSSSFSSSSFSSTMETSTATTTHFSSFSTSVPAHSSATNGGSSGSGSSGSGSSGSGSAGSGSAGSGSGENGAGALPGAGGVTTTLSNVYPIFTTSYGVITSIPTDAVITTTMTRTRTRSASSSSVSSSRSSSSSSMKSSSTTTTTSTATRTNQRNVAAENNAFTASNGQLAAGISFAFLLVLAMM